MGIRVQPRELDISAEDPFENDLLDRKESVEILTSIIGSIDGPCVLAVDAPWGTGKTTFLKMLAQSLRKQDFTVVSFNAWETDFAEDPFLALSSEITTALEEPSGTIDDLKSVIPAVMRVMQGPLLRIIASGIPYIGEQVTKELEAYLASTGEEVTTGYMADKEALFDFKEALRKAAVSLAEARRGRPLVVVIDELDRCRPSYAVALLEVAKHLFSVDQIVFVLAVDRSQLAHSIKVLYGQEFGAVGYLRRFFDIDYRLPEPDRTNFINATLSATGFTKYFSQAKVFPQEDLVQGMDLLQQFFSRSHLSLRHMAQAIHRLGIMFASLPRTSETFVLTLFSLLIVRTIDTDLYYQFIRGEITDEDVANSIFGTEGLEALRSTHTGRRFEAVLIVAGQEIDFMHSKSSYTSHESPLHQRYNEAVAQPSKVGTEELKHAESVLDTVEQLRLGLFNRGVMGVGVEATIQRIELLSPELKEEDPVGA